MKSSSQSVPSLSSWSSSSSVGASRLLLVVMVLGMKSCWFSNIFKVKEKSRLERRSSIIYGEVEGSLTRSSCPDVDNFIELLMEEVPLL